MSNGRIDTVSFRVGSLATPSTSFNAADETNDEHEALVYVPNLYSTLYKYGLLVLFDGLDYWRVGRLSHVIEDTFGERLPFLIALLPVAADQRKNTYSPDGTSHFPFVHAVAGALLRTLESRYALVPLQSARAIGGSSLGATMALSTVSMYPRRFGSLYLQSPAYATQGSDPLLQLPQGIKILAGIDAHLTVGTEEGERSDMEHINHVASATTANRNFLQEAKDCTEALQRLGCHAELLIRPGGHGWDAWQQDLPAILRSFALKLPLREERP